MVEPTPLKNISQLGSLFPIYGKTKKCSEPPTSYIILYKSLSPKMAGKPVEKDLGGVGLVVERGLQFQAAQHDPTPIIISP